MSKLHSANFWEHQLGGNIGILGGRPRVKGYRIGVEHVMTHIKGGAAIEEVMKHYPDLSREDILACIEYAEHEKESRKKQKRKAV